MTLTNEQIERYREITELKQNQGGFNFKQQLILTLCANPEFVKSAGESNAGKRTWCAMRNEIDLLIKHITEEYLNESDEA